MKTYSFNYQEFENKEELSTHQQQLVAAAQSAVALAYAPYSQFSVGAALLLVNGSIVKGSNQENASYPAGICAERVALGNAAMLHPGVAILAVAICYANKAAENKNDLVLSPCGICRQSLMEVQNRQAEPIELIMCSGTQGGILVSNVEHILPFAFSNKHL